MISLTWSRHFDRDDQKRIGFGDEGRQNPYGERFAARDYPQPSNAAVLFRLQAEALEDLSSPSGKSSQESRVRIRDGQVRVDTKSGSGQLDTMLLKPGRIQSVGNIVAQKYLADLEIVSSDEGIIREGKTRVKIDFNILNEKVDPGTGRLAIQEFDASGKVVVRSFEPSVTKTTLGDNRQVVRDQDGRLMKTSQPAGERTNCRVSYSGKSQCNWILRDKSIANKLGVSGGAVALDVTIYESHETRRAIDRSLNMKTIVRTLDGRELASVNQAVTLDPKGNIKSVDTDARRVKKGK
jgi:hypothetical protein